MLVVDDVSDADSAGCCQAMFMRLYYRWPSHYDLIRQLGAHSGQKQKQSIITVNHLRPQIVALLLGIRGRCFLSIADLHCRVCVDKMEPFCFQIGNWISC